MNPPTLHLFIFLALLISTLALVSGAGVGEGLGQLQQVLKDNGGREKGGEIVPGNANLRYCWKGEEEEDQVVIEYIELEPYPPVPGQNLTILASGFVRETIYPGSFVNVVVKMGWVTLVKKTFDLCEQSDSQLGIKCPIPRGPIEITKEVNIPKVVPPGKINVLAAVFNDDESPITCLMGEIQFH